MARFMLIQCLYFFVLRREFNFKSINTFVYDQESWRILLSLNFFESADLHVEDKCATLTESFGINANRSATFLNNLLNNFKSESNAFMIQISGPVKLAKLGK